MPGTTSAEIAARLDRLPSAAPIWRMVVLLSLGGCFEFYDLFFTAYVAPGMVKSGMFAPASLGVFNVLGPLGVEGVGTFVFATFMGLFVGALLFGSVADTYGRRRVFTLSLLWYSAATATMAFQRSGFGIDLWRFIGGIGIGVELVTIDTYISELVPRTIRGRAFAFSSFVTFAVVPVVALLAWLLVPLTPFGVEGWRWVVLIGAVGAIFVWVIRLGVPESPRWLARNGREDEAERIVGRIEAEVAARAGPLPPPAPVAPEMAGDGRFAEIWQPPYGKRTLMLSVFHFFQTIGYYGFAAWVPTLLIAKGITITKSLEYSFIIAVANPVGPLVGMLVADRMERKWQIVCAAACIGVFMFLFGNATDTALLIGLGVLVTLANNWLSFAFHNYQAELYPTRIRGRAIGFVYAWSRLSAAFAGLFIAFFLHTGGAVAVGGFIAVAMILVMITIGGFGPRTRGLALEAISH